MNVKLKAYLTSALVLATPAAMAQSVQLKVAAISAGAARLDNGSIVNIGQPLVGTYGSSQAGVLGNAGLVAVLSRAIAPPHLPVFNPAMFTVGGGIRLSFQADPGWTYMIQ